MFKYETRACPKCGGQFEALEFWDEDAPCGDCGTAAYKDRLRAINEAKPYTVESIGGACPTQAEGMSPTGRPYYFRARHGLWTLEVGEHGWPVGLNSWPGDGDYVAQGDDDTHGWMEDDDVLAILDEHLTAI